MTDDTVNATLVPLAAELIGVVRDFGPADVAAVLARVPDGRHDALAVVLAAMVDPDARPSELLAWTHAGPVQSRDKTPTPPAPPKGLTDPRVQVALLSAQGFTVPQISERLDLSVRAVARHRVVIRLMLGAAA